MEEWRGKQVMQQVRLYILGQGLSERVSNDKWHTRLLEESLLFTRFKMSYKLFHGEVFLQSSVTISVVKIIGIAIH